MNETDQTAEAAEQAAAEEEEQSAEGPKTEESVKPTPSDELKVVIILRDKKILLGVQSPDCDPVYTTFEGTLPTALQRVPKLVKEARQKWADSPRYPEADLPTPEPAKAPARTVAASKPKADQRQPSFF